MPDDGEGAHLSIRQITTLSLLWVGIPLLILFLWFKVYSLPDTMPQSHEVSPDRRMRISIVLEAHGTVGPVLYVARIGPNNSILNWIFGKKLIETNAADTRTPAPIAAWVDSQSAVIKLPVKPDRLAAAIRNGLYPHPAADRYGSVGITYQAQ